MTLRLLDILEEKKIQRGIIIFPGTMTPSARKVIVLFNSLLQNATEYIGSLIIRYSRLLLQWPMIIVSRNSQNPTLL